MDLLTLGRVLRRRWYVVVPVVSLATVAAVLVALNTPSTYEASGWLALETPELSPGDLPSSVVEVQALADEIVADLSTDEVSVRQADESTFEIAASSGQANAAEALVNEVVDDLTAAVESVQDGSGVPATERLRLRRITPSVVAEEQPDGSFVARTTLFLDNPAATADNPYGANASTSRLLEVAVTGNAGRAQFEELVGQNFDFEVILQQRDAAPLLQIVTLGPEKTRVLDAFYDVRDMLATELDVRQERAQVPPAARVTLGIVDAPLEVEDVSPPVSRATAGVAGLGVILAIGLAIAMESLDSRKRGAVGGPEKPSSASVERSGAAPVAPAPAQRPGHAPARSGSVQRSHDDVDAQTPSASSGDVVDAPASVASGDAPVVLGWAEESGRETDVAGPTGRPGDVPIVFSYAEGSGDTRVASGSVAFGSPGVTPRPAGEGPGEAADVPGPTGRPGAVADEPVPTPSGDAPLESGATEEPGDTPVDSTSEEAQQSDEPDASQAAGVTPRSAGQGTGDAAVGSWAVDRSGDVSPARTLAEGSGDGPVTSRSEEPGESPDESRGPDESGSAGVTPRSAGQGTGDAAVVSWGVERSDGAADASAASQWAGSWSYQRRRGSASQAAWPDTNVPEHTERGSRDRGGNDLVGGPTTSTRPPDASDDVDGQEPSPDVNGARPFGPSSHEPSARPSRASADDRADRET